MAFVKLVRPDGRDALPVADIIRRLRDEFEYVVADPEEGQDDVANVIAATLRMSAVWPGGEERVAALQAVQREAVYVWFGDDASLTAGCCLKPGWELLFGRGVEVDGPARPLVERAAVAIGYVVEDG
jgi:hypothetical protein